METKASGIIEEYIPWRIEVIHNVMEDSCKRSRSAVIELEGSPQVKHEAVRRNDDTSHPQRSAKLIAWKRISNEMTDCPNPTQLLKPAYPENATTKRQYTIQLSLRNTSVLLVAVLTGLFVPTGLGSVGVPDINTTGFVFLWCDSGNCVWSPPVPSRSWAGEEGQWTLKQKATSIVGRRLVRHLAHLDRVFTASRRIPALKSQTLHKTLTMWSVVTQKTLLRLMTKVTPKICTEVGLLTATGTLGTESSIEKSLVSNTETDKQGENSSSSSTETKNESEGERSSSNGEKQAGETSEGRNAMTPIRRSVSEERGNSTGGADEENNTQSLIRRFSRTRPLAPSSTPENAESPGIATRAPISRSQSEKVGAIVRSFSRSKKRPPMTAAAEESDDTGIWSFRFSWWQFGLIVA